MEDADGWFVCRVCFVETTRAVTLAAGGAAAKAIREEWSAFAVIEVDQALVEHASTLAVTHDLRSLDALHLAAALVLPGNDLVVATWDRRLHAAALAEGLGVLPTSLELP
jgi:predicted nucleic acid-binding protein